MCTNTRNHSIAKVLILIPIVVFAVTVVCLGLATILEFPTNRGVIYSVLMWIALFNIFIMPLPCLVMSAVGTVLAAKSAKEGVVQSRKLIVIGIIEIIASIGMVILTSLAFRAGMSV